MADMLEVEMTPEQLRRIRGKTDWQCSGCGCRINGKTKRFVFCEPCVAPKRVDVGTMSVRMLCADCGVEMVDWVKGRKRRDASPFTCSVNRLEDGSLSIHVKERKP